MPQNSIPRIIQYWFGPKYHHTEISPQQRLRWFGKDAAVGQEIRRLFHPQVIKAGDEKPDKSRNAPKINPETLLKEPSHLYYSSTNSPGTYGETHQKCINLTH